MKLLLRLSAIVMVVVCATWAYRVNYATQEAMNRVADLESAIAAEREALAVLDAEWAYLNRPDRLRALVAANAATLGLVELTPAHFGEVAMVAYPPEPEPETEGPAAVADADAAPDADGAAKPATVAARPRPAVRTASSAPKPAEAAPRAAKPAQPKQAQAKPAPAEPARPRTLQDLVNAVAAGRNP